ncbi:MAG TPA: hypothetical protein VE526_03640 [Solirubrobacteraceae bacterium]|jgi:hypothetical protein|nr:hypothetical protein [Solirubrobacteraceae bacterium]
MPRLRLLLSVLLVLLALPAAASAAPSQVMTFEAPDELMSDADRDRTLDEIAGLGVSRVRALVYWRDFTAKPRADKAPGFDLANPDRYPAGTWDRLDRLVAAAGARGIEVQLTLTTPGPDWATKKRNDGITRPSASQYGRWVTAVARRVGASVDLWSIMNEPNHPDFLAPQYSDGAPASPRIYRDLYVAAEKAIHGMPGGGRDKVLFGETAPIGNSNVVEPLVFLRGSLCLSSTYVRNTGCRKLRMEGFAHHAYARMGNPFFRSEDPDEVSIGSLDRLAKALDKAAKAGAIKQDRPIYLTEFGVQSYPDKTSGVPLHKQAEYLAISEHIAYVNPRVKAFSQYLMRDDSERKGLGGLERFGGFETGLRRSDGRKKPAYDGFMLPLRVSWAGASHVLWGRVRPATGSVEVTIQRDSGDGWKRLSITRTGTGGVFGLGTKARDGARYRVRWTRGDGATITGPPIRPY